METFGQICGYAVGLYFYHQTMLQVLLSNCGKEEGDDDDEGVDELDGARPSLGLRAGPCCDVASDCSSEDDNPLSTSLEPKYLSQSFQEDSDNEWSNCPDNLDFQQGWLFLFFWSFLHQ